MPPLPKPPNSNRPLINNGNIKNFFKPFTIPKPPRPANDVVNDDEEIIVATSSARSPVLVTAKKEEQRLGSIIHRDHGVAIGRSNDNNRLHSPSRKTVESASGGEREEELPCSTESTLKAPASSSATIASANGHASPTSYAQEPEEQVNTSFVSTTSNFSTSSSRRVINRNGWQAVTNSDSGSADSDSDDLLDMDQFVPLKKRKLTRPMEQEPENSPVVTVTRGQRQSARISNAERRAAMTRRSVTPPRPTYRHSLASLARRAQNQESLDSKLAEAEAMFEDLQRKRKQEAERTTDLENGLRIAAEDDSDEGERMKLAMQRTEAMQEDAKFYFFRGLLPCDRTDAFPAGDLPLPWMRDKTKWKRACLSGFVTDLAEQQRLGLSPDSSLPQWIFDRVMDKNVTDDVYEAYTSIMEVFVRQGSYDCLGLLHRNYRIFLPHDVQAESSLEQSLYTSETIPPPFRLRQILRFQRAHCPCQLSDLESLGESMVHLLFANIDDNIITDAGLHNNVQDTIECMLDNGSQELFDGLLREVHDYFLVNYRIPLGLCCRVISALPARTQRSHLMRRWLALHLFTAADAFGSYTKGCHWERTKGAIADTSPIAPYTRSTDSPEWFDKIIFTLQNSPHFSISEHTNYILLTALTAVLDIAIDAGFSPQPFVIPGSGEPLAKFTTTLSASFSTSSPSSAERDFNKRIDALSAQLHLIASRIRDAGTSHLRRTEAKSALERAIVRLEHGVRTRPKVRSAVFGRGLSDQRDFLNGFVRKRIGAQDDRDDDDGSAERHRRENRFLSTPSANNFGRKLGDKGLLRTASEDHSEGDGDNNLSKPRRKEVFFDANEGL